MQFNDSAGGQWLLELTVGDFKRVRKSLDINLAALDEGTPPLGTRLENDIVTFVDVLWVLVEPQAKERAITEEGFAALLGGEALGEARLAFWNALIDFFRRSGRQAMAEYVTHQLKMAQRVTTMLSRKYDEMAAKVEKTLTDQVDRKMNERLERYLSSGNSSTAGRGNSESIPADTAPAN